MYMFSSTIKDLLVKAEEAYNTQDAFRYKVKNGNDDGKKETCIESRSYTMLKTDSEKFSNMLAEYGEVGSHIAVLGTTSYSWIVSYFGIVNSGSVTVPIDALLPAEDVCDLLDRADVTTLVVDAGKSDVAVMAQEKCPKLKNVIVMNYKDKSSDIKAAIFFNDILEKYQAGFDCEIKPEQLATIMFTSGTTGKSKGVMLTHRNLAENATCLDMKFDEGTVLLSVLPIHHAFCLSNDILKALSSGCVICINDSLLRVAKNIKLFEPNMILMVPLMIETLVKKLDEAAWIPAPLVKAKVFGKQFHTIVSGGAYLNPAYIDKFKKFGINILQGYGMTECSPVISTNLNWLSKDGSVGKLMPN